MGYTILPPGDTLAFGISGIGDVQGGFFQNTKKLNRYHDAIESGAPPVERGYLLTEDDKLRPPDHHGPDVQLSGGFRGPGEGNWFSGRGRPWTGSSRNSRDWRPRDSCGARAGPSTLPSWGLCLSEMSRWFLMRTCGAKPAINLDFPGQSKKAN